MSKALWSDLIFHRDVEDSAFWENEAQHEMLQWIKYNSNIFISIYEMTFRTNNIIIWLHISFAIENCHVRVCTKSIYSKKRIYRHPELGSGRNWLAFKTSRMRRRTWRFVPDLRFSFLLASLLLHGNFTGDTSFFGNFFTNWEDETEDGCHIQSSKK